MLSSMFLCPSDTLRRLTKLVTASEALHTPCVMWMVSVLSWAGQAGPDGSVDPPVKSLIFWWSEHWTLNREMDPRLDHTEGQIHVSKQRR